MPERKESIIRTIEENRNLGGNMWQTFTEEELKDIYGGELPYWYKK